MIVIAPAIAEEERQKIKLEAEKLEEAKDYDGKDYKR
jgi:hypothetical protein